MATYHQMKNTAAIAAVYRPKAHVWRVVVNNPNALMYSSEYDNQKAAKLFAKRTGGRIIEPPPRLPFVIRRKYFSDSKTWELFAAFPTIAADSSSWYNWQAEAENGDSFSCSSEYWHGSRSVRGIDPARVAAFEARVRASWERDADSPFSLIRYDRLQASWQDQRKAEWNKGRAAE
jgi:hypothetical protein